MDLPGSDPEGGATDPSSPDPEGGATDPSSPDPDRGASDPPGPDTERRDGHRPGEAPTGGRSRSAPSRRRLLASLGALAGGLAGCLAPASTAPRRPDRGNVSSVAGVELPVPESELDAGGALGVIDPIVDPAFGRDWSGLPERGPLSGTDPVVGVVRDGRARAYPLRVVTVHEVVNDDLGGPLLVTYCRLCASAVTAVRRVGGRPATFGVSGLLWRNNLVMSDDRTGSLWSQVAATAIRGPATGERLELVPATLTTLADWRANHPETAVLLPPPESGTMHGSGGPNGSGRYDDADRRHYGQSPGAIGRYTHVLGVALGGEARAYPAPRVRAAGGVVNDAVGGRPVVVAVTAGDTLVAHERTVGDRVLRFSPGDRPGHFGAGGSTWIATTGTAVSGPHEGTTLRPASDRPAMFLRSWRDFHPGTTVYGGDPRD